MTDPTCPTYKGSLTAAKYALSTVRLMISDLILPLSLLSTASSGHSALVRRHTHPTSRYHWISARAARCRGLFTHRPVFNILSLSYLRRYTSRPSFSPHAVLPPGPAPESVTFRDSIAAATSASVSTFPAAASEGFDRGSYPGAKVPPTGASDEQIDLHAVIASVLDTVNRPGTTIVAYMSAQVPEESSERHTVKLGGFFL